MQTVQVKDRVESEVGRTHWTLEVVPETDSSEAVFVRVTDMDQEQREKAAKLLNVSPELILELGSHFESLKEAIHNDLVDIWEKVNK